MADTTDTQLPPTEEEWRLAAIQLKTMEVAAWQICKPDFGPYYATINGKIFVQEAYEPFRRNRGVRGLTWSYRVLEGEEAKAGRVKRTPLERVCDTWCEVDWDDIPTLAAFPMDPNHQVGKVEAFTFPVTTPTAVPPIANAPVNLIGQPPTWAEWEEAREQLGCIRRDTSRGKDDIGPFRVTINGRTFALQGHIPATQKVRGQSRVHWNYQFIGEELSANTQQSVTAAPEPTEAKSE